MNRLLACAWLAAVLPAFAAPLARLEARTVKLRLEPAKVHEECGRLEAGEMRRYYWKANAPVDFNIHYHRGGEVFFPVKRNAMRGDGGSFTARTAEDYCWMWTARNAPADIQGRIRASDPTSASGNR